MTRALAILAAMVVVATGCATRGAVTRLRGDLAQLRSELTYTRAAQETVTQDIAHATAELRALDARTRELAGRVRETADEAARLGSRTGAAEDAVRETRARVATLATPPPAPPVAPPPARPAAAQSVPPADEDPRQARDLLEREQLPPVERPAREPHEPRAVAPERAYAAAMASFRANEHGQAVLDLLDFLARYPKHPLAGNAQYWIGEAYYVQHDYPQALVEFQKVLDHGGLKMPEALVKIGLCHLSLRDRNRARQMWQRVVRDYPGSEPARMAASLLRTDAAAQR